ncbi:hypothetical protein GCM10008985_20950 [Halococcus dombrowskii]|uniref:Uncharacterized protein n=1 Tax=Halococcus dombrowskii TaxID=179637 RepID=A0AAV3SI31_HALDO
MKIDELPGRKLADDGHRERLFGGEMTDRLLEFHVAACWGASHINAPPADGTARFSVGSRPRPAVREPKLI